MSWYPIHHTFGPLADREQCCTALSLLLRPWAWANGPACEVFRRELGARFHGDVFLFHSGREGLLALLRALNVRSGDEVIVQGYTCIAVPNAIHAAGAVPVFADIDPETLNLTPATVHDVLSTHSRVLIAQHTFGIPAQSHSLSMLCAEKGMLFVEDCAHVLPDDTGPAAVTARGDVLLLSFGRDKAISGVCGGAIVCRKPELSAHLKSIEEQAAFPSYGSIGRSLLYPLLYAIARPLYVSGLGKFLLVAAKKLGLMIQIYTSEEKQGHMSPILHKLPNANASLALRQLRRLKQMNDHRRMMTRFYLDKFRVMVSPSNHVPEGITEDLPLQKFPLFIENADAIRTALKKQNIHLRDGWESCVICPASVDAACAGYTTGSDPKAESVSRQILALPTHPGMRKEQAEKILQELGG